MSSLEINSIETASDAEPTSSWRDLVGIVASIGCAIHCAAMPFVIAYLPALGLSFLADEAFHKWMALICFLIAIVAFVPGIRKHKNWTPISVGAVGLVLITIAAFGLEGACCASCEAASAAHSNIEGATACSQCECCSDQTQAGTATVESVSGIADSEKSLLSTFVPWVTPIGGILLVSAHLLNRRYGCRCGCCGPK